ncbi:MAG: hypothetical protein GF317_17275 [Candidatus Lokiarchaeota archaeon]|nr:hypothetical protein [Candidatus Lokiarchaeota archaeon]MBD3201271.1 hypothetical protein [Candidatus Lokiarchaeota archaeon]
MNFDKIFKRVKETGNLTEINDFLLELSQDPKADGLKYIKYFITNLNSTQLDQILLNTIYFLGELGQKVALEDYFLNFINQQFYHSDRWVRDEIIKSLRKIQNSRTFPKESWKIIEGALREDYEPIVNSVLDIFEQLNEIRPEIIKEIILLLDSTNNKIKQKVQEILERNINNKEELVSILTLNENYKSLTKSCIRSLVILFFQSAITLEQFRESIEKSNWEESKKVEFLKEIDTYQRILLRGI